MSIGIGKSGSDLDDITYVSVAPTIDKGAGGSKSVKVNRMTVWRINVKGEPPPAFSWWKVGQE